MVYLIRDESKNVEFPMASLQDALIIIQNGHPLGWGRMLEFPNNKDRIGLGYNTQNLKKTQPIAEKGQVLPLSEYFSSVCYIDDDHVCVVEEDVEDAELIFTETNGRGATKWTEIEIPEVTLIKM